MSLHQLASRILETLRHVGHEDVWPQSSDEPSTCIQNAQRNLAALQEYLTNLLTSRSVDEPQWFKYVSERELCNEALLHAGFAAVKYPDNVVVLSFTLTSKLRAAVRRGTVITPRSPAFGAVTEDILTAWLNHQRPPVVLFPWNEDKHWGMALAIPDKGSYESGSIFWGDSLNMKAPKNLLPCVRAIMNAVTKNTFYDPFSTRWITAKNGKNVNYILDTLSYHTQRNGFSCGFYTICAAWTFADRSNSPKGLPWDAFVTDDVDVATEKVRKVCTRMYISALLQVLRTKAGKCTEIGRGAGSTEMDVACLLIAVLRKKDVLQRRSLSESQKIQVAGITVETKKGSNPGEEDNQAVDCPQQHFGDVKDLADWMQSLNAQGRFTGSMMERELQANARYTTRLLLRCVEYQRRNKCCATVVMSKKRSNALCVC